jgi:hypothetical protein
MIRTALSRARLLGAPGRAPRRALSSAAPRDWSAAPPLVIRGGTVVNHDGMFKADVLTVEGKITKGAPPLLLLLCLLPLLQICFCVSLVLLLPFCSSFWGFLVSFFFSSFLFPFFFVSSFLSVLSFFVLPLSLSLRLPYLLFRISASLSLSLSLSPSLPSSLSPSLSRGARTKKHTHNNNNNKVAEMPRMSPTD